MTICFHQVLNPYEVRRFSLVARSPKDFVDSPSYCVGGLLSEWNILTVYKQRLRQFYHSELCKDITTVEKGWLIIGPRYHHTGSSYLRVSSPLFTVYSMIHFRGILFWEQTRSQKTIPPTNHTSVWSQQPSVTQYATCRGCQNFTVTQASKMVNHRP